MKTNFMLILIVTMAINSGMGLIIPVLPNLIVEDGYSLLGLSLPFLTLVFARILIKPYTGRLLYSFSAKSLLIVASVLYGLVFYVYSLNIDPTYFAALRFLEGLVEGIVGVIVTDRAIAYSSNAENKGLLMGLFSASFGAGFLLGPLVGSLTYTLFGLEAMFLSGCVFGILSLIASMLLPKENPKETMQPYPGIIKVSWQSKKYLGIYLPNILRRALLFSFMILVPLYVVNKFGISIKEVGYIFVTSAIITTILLPITGKLADRVDENKLVIFGLSAMAISIALIPLTSTVAEFLVLYVVETIAFAIMLPAATKIFADEVADDPNRPAIVGAFTGLIEVVTLILAIGLPVLYGLNIESSWILLAIVTGISIVPFIKRKSSYEALEVNAL